MSKKDVKKSNLKSPPKRISQTQKKLPFNPKYIFTVLFLVAIASYFWYRSLVVTPSINLADGLDAEEAAFLQKSISKDSKTKTGVAPAPVVKVTVKDKDTGEEYTGKVLLKNIDKPDKVSVENLTAAITKTVIENYNGIKPSPESRTETPPLPPTSESCATVASGEWAPTGVEYQQDECLPGHDCSNLRQCRICVNGEFDPDRVAVCGQGQAIDYITRPDDKLSAPCWHDGVQYANNKGFADKGRCQNGKWIDLPQPSPSPNNTLETAEQAYTTQVNEQNQQAITPVPPSNPPKVGVPKVNPLIMPVALSSNSPSPMPSPTNSPANSPTNTKKDQVKTNTLYAGQQCDDKFWTMNIPSCDKCKDKLVLDNTLTNGQKVQSCYRGEPMVDADVTNQDIDIAEPTLFNKEKNDGKRCDSGDPSSKIYCADVCKNAQVGYESRIPRCGYRDIVTEIKNCNGQAFHTWNKDLNQCLTAAPDTNYFFTPLDQPVTPNTVNSTGLIYIEDSSITQSPTNTTITQSTIEKASTFNLLNKEQNSNKSCNPSKLIFSCRTLCANGTKTLLDENNQLIVDGSGQVVVFCQ